jgi:hypothetical protein
MRRSRAVAKIGDDAEWPLTFLELYLAVAHFSHASAPAPSGGVRGERPSSTREQTGEPTNRSRQLAHDAVTRVRERVQIPAGRAGGHLEQRRLSSVVCLSVTYLHCPIPQPY